MDASRSRPLLFVAAGLVLVVGVLLTVFGRNAVPIAEVRPLDRAAETRAAAPMPSATTEPAAARVPASDQVQPERFEGWSRPVPCTLEGFVHEADGHPAGPGSLAFLRLQSDAGVVNELTTQIDALGHFRAENLEPWLVESVDVRDPARAPVTEKPLLHLVCGQTAHVDIELGDAYTLEGEILADDSDAPVPDVEIGWADRSAQMTWRVNCTSDASGRFTLRGLNPSGRVIENGVERLTFRLAIESGTLGLVEEAFTFDRQRGAGAYHASVRVVPKYAAIRGETRPFATVHLCVHAMASATQADQLGHFRFDALPVGKATIWAELGHEKRDYARRELDLKAGDNEVQLILPTLTNGCLRGYVRRHGGGALASRRIRAERVDADDCSGVEASPWTASTGADGDYELALPGGGRYRVLLEASNSTSETIEPAPYVIDVIDLNVAAKVITQIDFESFDGIVLAGRIEKAEVGVSYRVTVTQLERVRDAVMAELDAEGNFRVGPLAPGEYSLALAKMGEVLDLVHAGPNSTGGIVLRAGR